MNRLTDVIETKESKVKKNIQKLEDSLTALSDIARVPITFFSPEGHVLWEINRSEKLCIASNAYAAEDSSCSMNLKSAMKTAYSLGEVYIYACEAGLINMCHAFEIDGTLYGYFNAGPIAMGKSKERIIGNMCGRIDISSSIDIAKLLTISSDLQVRSPKEVTSISNLYTNTLNSFNHSDENKSIIHQRNAEQNMIGMKIIEMKKSRIEIQYPFAEEKRFIESLNYGSPASCKKFFSEYMGELIVFEGGNITVIKLRLMTLFSKLINHNSDLELEHRGMINLESINNASTISEIINTSDVMIDFISSNISKSIYSGNHTVITEAINYIRDNFKKNITLKTISQEIHVNRSYLSTLFKQEIGISIVEFINNLRLDSSLKTLEHSNESITEIAFSNGFREVSYFINLFKKKYGKTPKQYRTLLQQKK